MTGWNCSVCLSLHPLGAGPHDSHLADVIVFRRAPMSSQLFNNISVKMVATFPAIYLSGSVKVYTTICSQTQYMTENGNFYFEIFCAQYFILMYVSMNVASPFLDILKAFRSIQCDVLWYCPWSCYRCLIVWTRQIPIYVVEMAINLLNLEFMNDFVNSLSLTYCKVTWYHNLYITPKLANVFQMFVIVMLQCFYDLV